jgi:hypothetical protein
MIDDVKFSFKDTPMFQYLTPLIKPLAMGLQAQRRSLSTRRLKLDYVLNGHSAMTKREFVTDLSLAIERRLPYAAGKLGRTTQYMLRYDIVLEMERDKEKIKKFESGLEYQCLSQQGIFPADNAFYRKYNSFYLDHMRNLDCLGICYYPGELELLRHYRIKNKLIGYPCQEPFLTLGHRPHYFKRDDLLLSNQEGNGYLKHFQGKKILLICPFANFLKARANKQTFEAAWSKTGIKWFYPESVDALEFPYGFAADTRKRFETVLDLYASITKEIDGREFDIALIAAAGLAIPLASYIKKNRGKVVLDLGGILQVVFGVNGKRWLKWPSWREAYFNEHWVRVPDQYRPNETNVCDSGAYW